jgi:hypothetical protein
MKRFFKILGLVLIALIVLVIASPYLFKSQISDLIKSQLNQSLNATIDFSDLDLSFFSAFPDARVGLENLSVINKEPFAGDTLFYAREIKLDMPLGDVFNSAGEPIRLNEIIVNSATANFLVDQNGNANWDIAKASTSTTTKQADTTTAGFSFDLKHYEVNDSRLIYKDAVSTNYLKLDSLNHKGDGDFSLDSSTLDTYTEAIVTYSLDSVEYLSARPVKLDADILLNIKEQKYTFQENQALVNDLEIKLDGFVQLLEESTMVDLSFDTPSSDFKNFFALIPETYRGNLEGMTTTGDFVLKGTVKGEVTDERIPLLDINMSSSNASFKYADLPQRVDNITINASVKNETGMVEETFVDIPDVQFSLSGDRFRGSALVQKLMGNPEVDMTMNGTIDFANLERAIPFPENTHLNGRLALDAAAKFDMASIEQEKYQNINTRGTAKLTKFKYEGEALSKPLNINTADLDFSTSRIRLTNFDAVTGNTDLKANGNINNLIGFILQDQPLKGAFTVSSSTLDSSDFMTAQGENGTSTTSTGNNEAQANKKAIQIPDFLDAQLDFKVNRVLYDGLELANVSGMAIIRDETMTLNNVRTDVFNGNIGVNGSLTTKGDVPRFNMALDMNTLDIAKSFQGLEMFQKLVPIISALKGTISTDLTLSGNLNEELSPVIPSLTGDAFAQVLTKDVDLSANPLLSRLNNELDFLNLGNLNLSDLQTRLKFENGAVNIQPFDFKVKDINITASGSHSLQNEMNYVLDLNVPAKYLGKEGASLLSKLEDKEVDKIDVPIPVRLGGSMMQPKINLNLQQAITNLSNQIIEIQKQKLKDKGKDKLNETLNNVLNGALGNGRNNQDTTKPADSTSTTTTPKSTEQETRDKVKEAAGGLIRGLLKKKKDTTRGNG